MMTYVLAIGIGAGLGALMGAQRSCETGACPLTANPYRGAIWGAVMGFMVAQVFTDPLVTNKQEEVAMATAADSKVVSIVTQEDFDAQVTKAAVPVLVDLWAPWCGPCRAQAPILDEVAGKVAGRAVVAKVNVDEAPGLAEALRVNSIPTLVVFKGGKEVQRFVGVQTADTLTKALGL